MEQSVEVAGGPSQLVRSGGLVGRWQECCTPWLSSGPTNTPAPAVGVA